MSGRGKRLWAPHLDFEGAYQETLGFLKRCAEHKLPLSVGVPVLYRAYLVDGAWPMGDGQDLTRFLRFGYGSDPHADRAKQALARLLSVAVRAHFFLAESARVPHEPTVFVVPDLAQPGAWRYGISYPLDFPAGNGPARQRSLVVGEWDLALSAHRQPNIPRADEFPVVLMPDPFTWIPRKNWRALRQAADGRPWFELSSSPARQRLIRDVNAHVDRETFPFGTLLDYPIEMREDTAATGAMWARGVKSWFLPHGFDADAVKSYLDRLSAMSEEERMHARWWERRERKTRPSNKKPGA